MLLEFGDIDAGKWNEYDHLHGLIKTLVVLAWLTVEIDELNDYQTCLVGLQLG